MTAGAALHLLLHAVVPGLVAAVWCRPRWRLAWAVMLATMVVDADHLLADPVFDPARCSLGFHPLHRGPALAAWLLLALLPATRMVGLGLVIHMLLDALDCL